MSAARPNAGSADGPRAGATWPLDVISPSRRSSHPSVGSVPWVRNGQRSPADTASAPRCPPASLANVRHPKDVHDVADLQTLVASHRALHRHDISPVLGKERRRPLRGAYLGQHRDHSPAVGHESRHVAQLLTLVRGDGDEVEGRRSPPEPDLAVEGQTHGGRLTTTPRHRVDEESAAGDYSKAGNAFVAAAYHAAEGFGVLVLVVRSTPTRPNLGRCPKAHSKLSSSDHWKYPRTSTPSSSRLRTPARAPSRYRIR